MHHALQNHPATACSAVTGFDVELALADRNRLSLSYVLQGRIPDLSIPKSATARRVDGLWRHTCCELFIGESDVEAYYEFNFSPSTEWAAYRFDRYRSGMTAPDDMESPSIEMISSDSRLNLHAFVNLERLRFQSGKVRIALAAVVEDREQRMSYWALTHPLAKPDFHHAGGFVELTL